MSRREQAAICGTCGSAPGEPCREINRPDLKPSDRAEVGTHLARLHRVLAMEARAATGQDGAW